MDLYFLNFKRILVVLTHKDMRMNILNLVGEQDIDVNIKFADSYSHAAKLVNESIHDPYDHIVLNLSVNNSKLRDFLEYIGPNIDENPEFLIEYTRDFALKFYKS